MQKKKQNWILRIKPHQPTTDGLCLEFHIGVCACALCWGAGDDGLSQTGPVCKQCCGFGLDVMFPLCQVQLGRDRAHLGVCGRVEAVCCCCSGGEWCGGFTVTFFFGEGRNLAVLGLALDDHERVDGLDRLAVVRGETQHVVQHNGAVRKRLGRYEEALTQGSRGVGGEKFGKLGFDAVGSNNYVSRGKSEDGFVGKDREAFIDGSSRCVELKESKEKKEKKRKRMCVSQGASRKQLSRYLSMEVKRETYFV